MYTLYTDTAGRPVVLADAFVSAARAIGGTELRPTADAQTVAAVAADGSPVAWMTCGVIGPAEAVGFFTECQTAVAAAAAKPAAKPTAKKSK